ncbi:MAG: tRNA preQ1(34) S-adenosylmethionine ribosyltransferase-isomerase QueA [Fibrobacterota bacterium]
MTFSLPLSDFDFEVPPELVAQVPSPRGTSRMLVAPPGPVGAPLEHRGIADLPSLLRAGDCLVLNDTKVLKARLRGVVPTGGGVEVLLLEPRSMDERSCAWSAFAKPGRKLTEGRSVLFPGGVVARVEKVLEDGTRILRFGRDIASFHSWLAGAGELPLPPYVKRPATQLDDTTYQTVWGTRPGAVAAPTAGLHLGGTEIDAIRAAGVEIAKVTLHVGAGTFQPVAVENALDHPMHSERWEMSEETASQLTRVRSDGGRIVCVGTTSLRTVETVFRANDGHFLSGSGETRLFLHPFDPPRAAQGLLTNFHWPRTTLVLLVAGWLGSRERWCEVYETALTERYRLFSYGDCMLSLKP